MMIDMLNGAVPNENTNESVQEKVDHWFICKLSINYSPCRLSFTDIDKGLRLEAAKQVYFLRDYRKF